MILIDTSAWIELLRATQSPTHLKLRGLIETGADLAVTETVVMELLGGARQQRAALRRRLLSFPLLPLRGLQDFEEAATISDGAARVETPSGAASATAWLRCPRCERRLPFSITTTISR